MLVSIMILELERREKCFMLHSSLALQFFTLQSVIQATFPDWNCILEESYYFNFTVKKQITNKEDSFNLLVEIYTL